MLTTHYLEEAERLCDRVAIIHAGEIVALDTPSALLAGLGGELLELRVEGDVSIALAALGVAGRNAYAAQAGQSVKQAIGEVAADAAIGAIIMRLPGGLIASFALGLESDNQYQIEMSKKIDALTPLVPRYDQMSNEDKQATRAILRELIENPIDLDPPPPPSKPKLPGFHWPGEMDPDKMAGEDQPRDDEAVA